MSSAQTADHYLALPSRPSAHGILVLHSWWGLNAFFRDLCDRLALKGFVALAPDLYGGKVARTISDAKRLRATSTANRKEPVYKFLIREIHFLSAHSAVRGPKIATLGYSMGGHWALWLAQRPQLPIAATVTFYAARAGDFSATRSAFLCHFAEHDEWVKPNSVKKLRRQLELAGVSPFIHTYPGTEHWFFERDRSDTFDRRAADLAWRRTIVFLRRNL